MCVASLPSQGLEVAVSFLFTEVMLDNVVFVYLLFIFEFAICDKHSVLFSKAMLSFVVFVYLLFILGSVPLGSKSVKDYLYYHKTLILCFLFSLIYQESAAFRLLEVAMTISQNITH